MVKIKVIHRVRKRPTVKEFWKSINIWRR